MADRGGKNLEIENRIKTITEGITGANLTESEANAQKAIVTGKQIGRAHV